MKHSPALPTPTFSEVQSRFTAWRKNKQSKCIPEELWEAAVTLNPEYSVHKISRGLSLSHADLKERIASTKTRSAHSSNLSHGFVAIDIPPMHSAECIIEMEHRTGNKMRMHFKGTIDLDLQSFAESFWSDKV
jgi:hypothetical protein